MVIGDIVQLSALKQPGMWCISRIEAGAPNGTRFHCSQDRLGRRWGIDVGSGNISVVKSVAFQPGQVVKYRGAAAVVIEDRPDEGLVSISYTNPPIPLKGGGALAETPGRGDVKRSELVLHNIKKLLEES